MLCLTCVILWYSMKIFFWRRTHCVCLWFHWWGLKHWYRVNLLYCRFVICLSWIDFAVFSRWERSTVGVSVCLWVDWCLQHWRCAAGLWADWWRCAPAGGHQPDQLRHRHRPPDEPASTHTGQHRHRHPPPTYPRLNHHCTWHDSLFHFFSFYQIEIKPSFVFWINQNIPIPINHFGTEIYLRKKVNGMDQDLTYPNILLS